MRKEINSQGAGMNGGGLLRELQEARLEQLEAVLNGMSLEIDATDLMLAIEADTTLRKFDHHRLIRAAALAVDYWKKHASQNQPEKKFIEQFALACGADATALGSYCLVVGNEIRDRKKTGKSPLEALPSVVDNARSGTIEAETLALSRGSTPKHSPAVYVELWEQGLGPTAIADRLGDVSEASVRRGLKKAGIFRAC